MEKNLSVKKESNSSTMNITNVGSTLHHFKLIDIKFLIDKFIEIRFLANSKVVNPRGFLMSVGD